MIKRSNYQIITVAGLLLVTISSFAVNFCSSVQGDMQNDTALNAINSFISQNAPDCDRNNFKCVQYVKDLGYYTEYTTTSAPAKACRSKDNQNCKYVFYNTVPDTSRAANQQYYVKCSSTQPQ